MSPLNQSGAFAALSHRNYRLIWGGQLVSTAGSLMQNAAVLWHVSLLADEHSRPLALGLVGFFKFSAILVCALFSGVVADAFDRRKLMMLTTSILTVLAALLATVTFLGLEHPWPIYLLTALSSGVGTFDGAARQSLIPNLVPRLALPSAIALNTILYQAASSAGPALSGHVMVHFGLGWVYVVNAASYLAVIGALAAMRDVPRVAAAERGRVSLQAAREGLHYVFRAPLIRSSMLLDFLATFFSSATALLPIFATDVLHVGEEGYGYLVAAPAVGALITSAVLAPLAQRIVARGKVLIWAVVLYGLATVLFGVSKSFWLTYVCLALTGAADTVSIVLRNIIRQLTTPDALRGRMISVNMIFFMGGPQLGELEAGVVAQAFGAVFSVVSGGVLCVLATLGVAWREPQLRAYRREDPLG
ncbi:MAG: MFS transporter [Planctomycetes bacterium]|nr:MFS transporter [Planctomycetota bacterium]